ncbi:MAG TPA: glycosyltransferase family 4 protein [Acidimicrobiales bacterium]
MRVLLFAYSARAGRGSEPALGWGWARHLAEAGHEVTLLTHARNEGDNRAWLDAHPRPNLTMACVDSGRAGTALRAAVPWERPARVIEYVAWRRAARREARRLHGVAPFDVVHHVTYSSIVPGSPVCRLGVPFVLGPLGGGQRAPARARALFGKAWRLERLRTAVVTATGAGLNPLARASVRHATTVLATNDATLQLATRLGARRAELMADTGLDAERVAAPRHGPGGERPCRVLWVGTLTPIKAPRLALEAVARARRELDVELHVVGGGPQRSDLGAWAAELGIEDAVRAHGTLPWAEVMELYATCDALLFTSVRDSLGSQLVEAAASGLPIVAVDLHGAASIVPSAAALKVPFVDVGSTAAGLARALVRVLTDETTYGRLSRGAIDFARSQTWPARVRRIEQVYDDATGAALRTAVAG